MFNKCTACHTIEKGAPNQLGPNLWGVLGEPIGKGHGFAFSDALASKGGTWTWDSLSEWLKSPKAFAPGTKMTFAGLSNPQDRAKIMAFMNTRAPSDGAARPYRRRPKATAAKAGAEPPRVQRRKRSGLRRAAAPRSSSRRGRAARPPLRSLISPSSSRREATEIATVPDTVNADPARRLRRAHVLGDDQLGSALEISGPTYNRQPLVYAALAAQKNHNALYLNCVTSDERTERLRQAFAAAGKKLDMGKSCIRFRRAEDLALDAIADEIASATPQQYVAMSNAARSG